MMKEKKPRKPIVPKTPLTPAQREEIRRLFESGMKCGAIAKQFGLTYAGAYTCYQRQVEKRLNEAMLKIKKAESLK